MSKTIYRDECQLYGILRKPLFCDLIANGWPASVAGSILNWFDPANDCYLDRVGRWQKAICRDFILDDDLPIAVRNFLRTDSLSHVPWHYTRDLHLIAKMFYKFRGQVRARQGEALESAKTRFTRPGRPNLSASEKRRLKHALSALRPLDLERLIGCYGTGCTSDGLDNFERWCRDGVFPTSVPITCFISSLDDYVSIGKIRYCRHGITKVAEVAKNIKTNRIVSSENANWMFAQKAVGEFLSKELHRIFKGNVYLHDASRHNELLWHYGFRSIDLSDASDHITRSLVHAIFPESWVDGLFKVRSSFARFPDGSIVPLRTFAPMGSGDTFPVLTAVCLAVCKICCQHTFHCYGDDLIVHTDDFDYVCEMLTKVGLVVNESKCALSTNFRESCGLDIIFDEDITPVQIREDWTRTYAAKLEVISSKLEGFGFTATRDAILNETSPIRRVVWDRETQVMKVEVLAQKAKPQSKLPGQHALFRWFCNSAETDRVARRDRNDERLVWQFEPADNYRSLFRCWLSGKCRRASGAG